jgi:DNA-binding MarR family transcriptional regulator
MVETYDLEREHLRARLHSQVEALFHIEDTSGIELFSMLHRVAQLSDTLDCLPSDEPELSGPRWRLMLRLLIEEQIGNPGGLTPTILSHSQRVSKNTISSLLRGLEEQGFIQRNLDPKDLRIFRIQLTEAGRELILETAPKRIECLNGLLSGLGPEEREQLRALLEKLQHSLMVRCHLPQREQK